MAWRCLRLLNGATKGPNYTACPENFLLNSCIREGVIPNEQKSLFSWVFPVKKRVTLAEVVVNVVLLLQQLVRFSGILENKINLKSLNRA